MDIFLSSTFVLGTLQQHKFLVNEGNEGKPTRKVKKNVITVSKAKTSTFIYVTMSKSEHVHIKYKCVYN